VLCAGDIQWLICPCGGWLALCMYPLCGIGPALCIGPGVPCVLVLVCWRSSMAALWQVRD
jgi:hypothetical protein